MRPVARLAENVLIIEYWNLGFICNLVPGICDFIKAEHYHLIKNG
jgi:hypothetical protein